MKTYKPMDAFFSLLDRIIFTDRWRKKGPGKVVESMPDEAREALSQLKSSDISGDKVRVEDYDMVGKNWEGSQKLLEFERKLGIKPPARKKYGDYEGQ